MSNKIQEKFLQFESEPPTGIWDRIAATLDNQTDSILINKLYAFEEKPGKENWEKIKNTIDQPDHSTPKVIPFFKNYNPVLKYAGAAAVLLLIGLLSIFLLNNRQQPGVSSESIVHNNRPFENKTGPFLPAEDSASIAKLSAGHLSGKTKERSLPSRKNSLAIQPLQSEDLLASLNDFPSRVAQRNVAITGGSPADKYMVYSDGQGNATRLPKKLFEAFACATDRIPCLQKLKELQEKIASTAVSSDFTGILEILNNLEENQ